MIFKPQRALKRTLLGSLKDSMFHPGTRGRRTRLGSIRAAGGKASRRLREVAIMRLRRSRTGALAEVAEALREQGPQQVFRLFPWLTRLVAAWSLLAFFATDLPMRAAITTWNGSANPSDLLWSNPANWVSGVPTINDTATFSLSSGTVGYIDSNTYALSLNFVGAGSVTLLGGT
ncbi:MAG: hypothetical protein WCL08_13190, partial [Verrucomicrobiota bacterium]